MSNHGSASDFSALLPLPPGYQKVPLISMWRGLTPGVSFPSEGKPLCRASCLDHAKARKSP